jgi:hypothetical protein
VTQKAFQWFPLALRVVTESRDHGSLLSEIFSAYRHEVSGMRVCWVRLLFEGFYNMPAAPKSRS